jgi:hypothetical protein
MFKLNTYTLFTFVYSIIFSQNADAGGRIKVNTTMTDTESRNLFSVQPSAELAFASDHKSPWTASVQFRLTPAQANELNPNFNVTIKESNLTRKQNHGRISLGRILVRPASSSMNEPAKSFLRSEPAADGLRYAFEQDDDTWSIFVGGPQVLGGSYLGEAGKTKFIFTYRGERNKIAFFPVISLDSIIKDAPHASHTNETELLIKNSNDLFRAEGVIQMMIQGAQRIATLRERSTHEYFIGEINPALPRTIHEYRAAAQVSFPIDRSEESETNFMLSIASRTAPRHHTGSEDQKFFRQGSGGETQLVVASEFEKIPFYMQTGLTAEYSASPKYSFASQKNSTGLENLYKLKSQIWTSIRLNF